MISSKIIAKIAGILTEPEAFYAESHRVIYRAALAMYERGDTVDLTTLVEELRRTGQLATSTGITSLYLSELAMRTVTPGNADKYARIVWENYLRRRLIDTSRAILHLAADETGDIFDDLGAAREKLNSLMETGGMPSVGGGLDEVLQRDQMLNELHHSIFNPVHGDIIPTGYPRLDRAIGGLRKGECIGIAGRPGSGKTAFATSMACNVAGLGTGAIQYPKPFLILELEMARRQIWARVIAPLARVNSSRFGDPQNVWTQDEARRITEAINLIGNSGLYIDTFPKYTLPLIRSRVEKLIATKGIAGVVIDHAGKIRLPRGHSKHDEVGTVAVELKAMAKEFDIPVIPLWQLNRKCEDRNPPRPYLSDLRESGTIEEEADIMLMVYRPEYYKLDTFEDGSQAAGMGDIQVEKNRDGMPDIARLAYVNEYARWENFSHRNI